MEMTCVCHEIQYACLFFWFFVLCVYILCVSHVESCVCVRACFKLQSQVELAALYLDKWRAGSGAEDAPEPLQLIQEIIFRPHRCVVLFLQICM